MRGIQVGDTKTLTVKDEERKRRPELSQLPLRSSGQMWSPWAVGKRVIRGCKRQTELKETQQQHPILFLAYLVQGAMLNICFVGCGIKPKLEKYLTIECCPLYPPPILGLNSLLSSPRWIFTPSRRHCTIVWLNFKVTGTCAESVTSPQPLCEWACPFIHRHCLISPVTQLQ